MGPPIVVERWQRVGVLSDARAIVLAHARCPTMFPRPGRRAVGQPACRAGDTRRVQVVIRRLVEADVEPVVDFSLAAWEPVFAGIAVELGSAVYRMLFPDWRSAQARAVEAVCRSPEHEVWVAVGSGRAFGFVAVRHVEEDAARAGEIDMVAVDPRCQRAGVGARSCGTRSAGSGRRGWASRCSAREGTTGTHRPARSTSPWASARSATSGTTRPCERAVGRCRRGPCTPAAGRRRQGVGGRSRPDSSAASASSLVACTAPSACSAGA